MLDLDVAVLSLLRPFFSQKLTSWVFNDRPCECADVGHSETIGRPGKMAWQKKLLPNLTAKSYDRSCGTDPILSTQRFPRGRDPTLSTQRIGGGDLEENGHFL